MNSLTSNAYNFSEYFSSGVDPRTGMFTMSISLGEFLSYRTSGESIPLTIGYSPTNIIDQGFGRGWSFPVSYFDAANNQLSLSTGQSFKVEWDTKLNEYLIPIRGIKDIGVFYNSDTNEIKVVFKDGNKEYLCYEDGYTKRTVSPNGLIIHFEYEIYRGNLTLWRIYDNEGREFEIDWWTDEFMTTVYHKLNNISFMSGYFYKRGIDFELEYFQIKGCNDYIRFQYQVIEPSGYKLITKLTHPTGMVEELEYLNSHYLQKGAPITVIPAVSKHIRYIAENCEPQITTYKYTDHNYLGFGSDRKWISNQDNLFEANVDYKYSSVEVVNGDKKIVRTYNKYHLLDKEVYFDDDVQYKKMDFTYFADLDVSIENQPPQYSLLKSKKVTFYKDGILKEFVTTFDYDIYGNKLYEVMPDGTVNKTEFYPIEGEEGKCPPSSNKMVAFKKSESMIPKNSKYPARVTTLEYKKINLQDDNKYFVVLKKEMSLDSATTYEYHEDYKTIVSFGRVHKMTETLNDIFVCNSEISYENIDNQKLKITTKVTTFDSLVFLKDETFSYDLYKLIEINRHDEAIKTNIYFDHLGREVKTVLNEGKENEQTSYKKYDTTPNKIYIIETDANGNVNKVQFDNAGNPIKTYLKPKGEDQFYVIESIQYDVYGMAVSVTEYDWYEKRNLITIETKYKYDNNGNISQINHADGRVEYIDQDSINSTTTHKQKGLLTEVSYFDSSSQVIKKETYDAFNQLVLKSEYQYDGYGNQIKITDNNGNVIDFTYDKYDRVLEVKRCIDNEVITEKYEYAEKTMNNVVSKVFLDEHLIGEREFDGLFRITKETNVGVIKEYVYDHLSARILQTKTPSDFNGNQYIINMTYESLNKKMSSLITIPGQNLNKSFTYDSKGHLLSKLNASCKQTYTYDSFFRIIKEDVELNNSKILTSSSSVSLKNRIKKQIDFDGCVKLIGYDEFGRPNLKSEITDTKETDTQFVYDKFSRIEKILLHIDRVKYSLEIQYNALSVEIFRCFKDSQDNVLFTISQEYKTNSLLLQQRTYTEGPEITIESYEYDCLNRLVKYSCQGSNMPKDEYNNVIKSQDFTHDKYSNITNVKSIFSDGTNNSQMLFYVPTMPTKLGRVKNTHPSYPAVINCLYDANGNLVNDQKGRMYAHNILGQLDTVYSDENSNNILTSYEYDASGRLTSQKCDDRSKTYFYYMNDKLRNEMTSEISSVIQEHATGFRTKRLKLTNTYSEDKHILMGDANESTLMLKKYENKVETTEKYQYMPYGHHSKRED